MQFNAKPSYFLVFLAMMLGLSILQSWAATDCNTVTEIPPAECESLLYLAFIVHIEDNSQNML